MTNMEQGERVDFTPLSVRMGWRPATDWERPRTALTSYLRLHLIEWTTAVFEGSQDLIIDPNVRRARYPAVPTFLLRFDVPVDPYPGSSRRDEFKDLLNRCRQDDHLLLEFIDFTLFSALSDDRSAAERENLDTLFQAAFTVWRVRDLGEGRYGLVTTVSDVADAAGQLAASGPRERANEHLRRAWAALYGMKGANASHAYREAVKAIEAAAGPIFQPNPKRARTLGTILNEYWTGDVPLEFVLEGDAKLNNLDTVVGMMKLVWKTQDDRHADEDGPLDVSAAETEAALFTAVAIVQFLQAGHLRRTDSAPT